MSLVDFAAVVSIAALVASLMEPWSRFVHARFWHGPLYRVHQTHHPDPTSDRRWLEANDLFSLVHGIPAAVAIYLGLGVFSGPMAVVTLGVGIGLCVYGLAYMIVHDGLVHGRLPVGFLKRWRYFRRVRAAHEIHHRDGGAPYGLFLGPQELRMARSRYRSNVPLRDTAN